MADRRLVPARVRGGNFPAQAGSSHAAPARSPDQAEVTVGAQLRKLRKAAGLSQRALAERVGTTASVICRLEDEAYGGHTLDMLRRIGSVLGKKVDIRFLAEGAENQAQITSVLPLPPAVSADPEGN